MPFGPESHNFEQPAFHELDQGATHIIRSRLPEGYPEHYKVITDQSDIGIFLFDEARFPGGSSEILIDLQNGSTEADVAYVLNNCNQAGQSVIAVGPQTSLTGASVPMGDVLLNMANRKKQSEITSIKNEKNINEHFITVQSGVTLNELNENISKDSLFLPSSPTYGEATVIGAISTNAAGARSYKYGSMRNYVEALKIVLPTGDVLDVRRGQYVAHPGDEESPGGYFELEYSSGIRRVPIPTYTIPDVPKVSAGYYAKEGMDLVDLIVGSEGTLGVITEATIKVIEEPPTELILVPCENDKQALELINRLRNQEPEKRETLDPGGISAVEFISENAMDLVPKHFRAKPLDQPGSLVLVQVENVDDSFETFMEICEEVGVEGFEASKDKFIGMRESVPLAVNEKIAALKVIEPNVTKIGADPCVISEYISEMIAIYEEEFADAGVDYYFWGHGEGNLHFNAIPKNSEQVDRAKKAILKAGKRIINKLKGTGTAEHAVGKNDIKKELIHEQYGDEGIEEMRTVKFAFDPNGIMAPGNII